MSEAESKDVIRSTRAKTYRQSTLSQSFKSNKSSNASQHPLSDDFPDDEISNIFGDVDMQDTSPSLHVIRTTSKVSATAVKASGDVSTEDETFDTPPTSPSLQAKKDLSGLALPLNNPTMEVHDFRKPAIPDSFSLSSRKRPFSDTQKPSFAPRKASRESSTSSRPYHAPNDQDPVLMHKNPSKVNGILPTPPMETGNPFSNHFNNPRSFSNSISCTSSMSAASSAWTSPNTSFSTTGSATTSFSADGEGTDFTVRTAVPMTRRLNLDPFSGESKHIQGSLAWSGMNISPQKMDVESESGATASGIQVASLTGNIGDPLTQRLLRYSPFGQSVPTNYSNTPLRQIYEVVRVASFCKAPLGAFDIGLRSEIKDYNLLWSSLAAVARARNSNMPQRSSSQAWDRSGSNFEGVSLGGSLIFSDDTTGLVFKLSLNPLRIETSYRLARQFGSDRFSIFRFPGLGPESLPSYMKSLLPKARETILKWLACTKHEFLGRIWRFFYVKPEASKKITKGRKKVSKDTLFRVYLFAEDGVDFSLESPSGEVDTRKRNHHPVSVEDMLKWFMPFKINENQPALKLFARIALGVSTTKSTVVFKPSEIFRSDDMLSDNPCERRLHYGRSDEKKKRMSLSKSQAAVMSDGCARISKEAARGIADMLGLQQVPCAFQGRIAGAKGMWIVDTLGERPFKSPSTRNYWIEISDSQLKFESHPSDALHPPEGRVTFEVNDYVKKLSPSQLNFQLMPILENRGVPAQVIMNLLEADLTARDGELKAAMDSGLSLRLWNQQTSTLAEERLAFGGIEFQGGLPLSRPERINWLTEQGFEPKRCRYLKEQLYQAIRDYCVALESRLNVGIGQSTYAFMIADPLGVLEENEVHMCFSGVFRDPKSDFDQTMLHDLDVLVARLPAHLPSDIQKVRAVFKPELRIYRDVIIFPTKGSTSLASRLSGGDYDGDRAWVCWEPSIVDPFVNAIVPKAPAPSSFGIVKDHTKVADFMHEPADFINKFVYHGFDFNLQPSMLGTCTVYHESFCYMKNCIDSPAATSIAALLGLLVDSAKAGLTFDGAKWNVYLTTHKLPRNLRKPSYKDRDRGKPTKHLIDRLVFEIAKGVKDKVLGGFSKQFENVSPKDDDLFRICNEEYEQAKSDRVLDSVFKKLEIDLKALHDFYLCGVRTEDDEFNFNRKERDTFRALVEQCREKFVTIAPTPDNTVIPESNRITEWQRDHSRGRKSRWDLLKASYAFYRYNSSSFVWYIAGIELVEIKATARGAGTYRPVVNGIFDAMKVDSKFVARLERRGILDDVVEEVDEFGEWGWEDEF